jgi:hypothetical protein
VRTSNNKYSLLEASLLTASGNRPIVHENALLSTTTLINGEVGLSIAGYIY